MPEALKNYFASNVPHVLADRILEVYPSFNHSGFVKKACSGFDELELLPRGKKIAQDLHEFLPENFIEAVEILKSTMNQPLIHTDYKPMASFFYMPHLNYVAFYGLNHLKESLSALHYMTQRFSAEFAIRPFIEKYPKEVFAVFQTWKMDSSKHVRRLVSEGTRPLLPWASRLKALQKDPSPSLDLLSFLFHDSEEYVRRSVANHLNDIGKDHPEMLLLFCKKHFDAKKSDAMWIIKHALRSLIKKGNQEAIGLFGYAENPKLVLSQTNLSSDTVKLGSSIQFEFSITNESAKQEKVLLDFVVHFRKANGQLNPKVFKLTQEILESRQIKSFSKTIKFVPLTTRKLYSGIHQIDILINGRQEFLGTFNLVLD